MKKLIVLAIVLSSTAVKAQDTVRSQIALAGDQLAISHKKKVIGRTVMLLGAGIAFMGSKEKEGKPVMMFGYLVGTVGTVINMSALHNLGKAAKHLKRHDQIKNK